MAQHPPWLWPAFFEALTTPRRWRDTDVTPFEKTRVLDPSPDRATIDAVFDLVRKTYAPFRSATPVQRWAGYIDVLPDVIPVISPTQGVKNGLPGLFVATGFSGHGFGLGPGAGLLAADLITGLRTLRRSGTVPGYTGSPMDRQSHRCRGSSSAELGAPA